MIPRGAQGVGRLSTRIVADLIPKAADAYMAADLGMLAGLLGMVAEDYDRTADVLVADLDGIRAIFQAALGHIEDETLIGRMSAVAEGRSGSLRIGDLSARADAALRTLIDLHARVEDAEADGAPWAAGLNRAIWTFLDAHVARRAYDTAF